MEMTLREAAEELGVTPREAQRLAAAGRLQITRRIGRTVLVDDSSVVSRGRQPGGRGRRWSQTTAWAALELLDLGVTDRLTGSSLSRLRRRLRAMTVEEMIRAAGDRCLAWRAVQTRRSPRDLAAELMPTGESALSSSTTAQSFGLSASPEPRIEGYALQEQREGLERRYGLVADADGEVTLRLVDTSVRVTESVIALDLIDRGGTREEAAGREMLARRLQAYRA